MKKNIEAEEEIEILEPEISETEGNDSNIMPAMNVNNMVKAAEEEKESIVSDAALLNVYDEIMNDLRKDRKEVTDMLTSVVDMVINSGDATTASKEAMVNLMKLKTEIADKKAKIADLMTRVKLKEKDTFPRYLSAQQNNTIKIEGTDKKRKRELMRIIEQAKEKGA